LVVDGDTIEISPAVDGNEEVRLIGMDTPETKDPSEGIEPLSPEASAFATDEVTGQSVGLEFDVEREDQYDRLLAYVYLDGEMFNEVLVEEGLAQAYPYEPNTRYEERFAAAQEEARAANLGIWGLTFAQQCQLADRGNGIGEGSPGCAGASASTSASASSSASAGSSATANPSPDGAVPPISEDDCPSNAPIKGNQSIRYLPRSGRLLLRRYRPRAVFCYTPRRRSRRLQGIRSVTSNCQRRHPNRYRRLRGPE
jgi:micrococcal nuclease